MSWIPTSGRLRSFGVRVSIGTLLFGLATGLIGLAAVNADINLLMVLFGLCIGILILGFFSGWMILRKIDVERQAPEVVFSRQPFEMRYIVRSRRTWGCARGLHIAESLPADGVVRPPEAFLSMIRPGESVTVDVPMISRTRGRVLLNSIGIATSFPFGLFTKYVAQRSTHELVIMPALGQLQVDIQTALRTVTHLGGEGAPARQMGDEEYYGIREYRLGDNPRRIHWRRSARTGQLVVREMSRSAARQLWCVVNTRIRPGSSGDADRLERAISCAATVIVDALERGVRVGLLCNGDPLVVLPPGGGRAHRPRLLRELAIRGTNTSDALTPHIERMAWPTAWRGPCMIFCAVESDDTSAAALALSRRLGSTTVYISDTAAFDAFFTTGRRKRRQPGAEGHRRLQPATEATA